MLSGRKSISLLGNKNNNKISLSGCPRYLSSKTKYVYVKNKNIGRGIDEPVSQDYINLKLDIIKNYIEPVLYNKNMDDLSLNYHMISLKIENLKNFSNEANKNEVFLLISSLNIIKNSINSYKNLKDYESKYNISFKNNQMYLQTSRIILDTKYEIYNNLFGAPEKDETTNQLNYDESLLNRIEYLLKALDKPTFKNIALEMKNDIKLFLPEHQRDIEKLISSYHKE